ncbi:YbaB/EbfC family nucleoid-associated protein [bacterium]|nr:YbaB/EbfC family nucleoid-associated protein [bacterium]
MGTGFTKIIKQLKKMQENFFTMEEELQNAVFEGSSGGGAVKVSADGAGNLVSIKIDPEVVKSGDVEMLQDLVLAAVSQAQDKASEHHKNELNKMAGEVSLPRIPGLGG